MITKSRAKIHPKLNVPIFFSFFCFLDLPFFEIVFFVFASKTFLSGNLLGQKSRVSGIVITYSCKEVYPQHASLTRGINPSTKYSVESTYNKWYFSLTQITTICSNFAKILRFICMLTLVFGLQVL